MLRALEAASAVAGDRSTSGSRQELPDHQHQLRATPAHQRQLRAPHQPLSRDLQQSSQILKARHTSGRAAPGSFMRFCVCGSRRTGEDLVCVGRKDRTKTEKQQSKTAAARLQLLTSHPSQGGDGSVVLRRLHPWNGTAAPWLRRPFRSCDSLLWRPAEPPGICMTCILGTTHPNDIHRATQWRSLV